MPEIRLDRVAVDIPIYGAGSRNLKGTLARLVRRRPDSDTAWIRALDGIDLHVREGDRLGLVGANGGGKTTLLRVVAGILAPSAGTRAVTGSVAAMFDIGLGMDYDATGEENIVIRGMVLGHSRADMEARAPSIVEFAGLGDRIRHPIRTYSSGMVTRLAFSISTSIEPDILVVDEGIGMADAEFTARARGRLAEFVQRAGIVVMASHSDALVEEFCTHAAHVDRGRVVYQGEPAGALAHYRESLARSAPAEA